MNDYLLETLARTTIEDRLRTAEQLRPARALRRSERAPREHAVVRQPRRHSRLWNVLHFRHAYS